MNPMTVHVVGVPSTVYNHSTLSTDWNVKAVFNQVAKVDIELDQII